MTTNLSSARPQRRSLQPLPSAIEKNDDKSLKCKRGKVGWKRDRETIIDIEESLDRTYPKKDASGIPQSLCGSYHIKPKDLSKRNRKTMESDLKWWGSKWASIASETFLPTESPMGPLRSRLHLLLRDLHSLHVWNWAKGEQNGLRVEEMNPSSPEMLALPVPHPTRWGGKRRSCHEIFLKERAQRLHRGLIKSREIAGKGRGMRQVRSPKQCHERLGKRKEPLRKRLQGSFSAHGVAYEHHDKINHLVVPHPRASKPHALLDGFLQAKLVEHMRQNRHFS
jgi:hypothetical protein